MIMNTRLKTLDCGPFEACRTSPRHQQLPTYGPAAGYMQCKLQKITQCHSIQKKFIIQVFITGFASFR